VVEALITCSEDARFRNLPVGLFGEAPRSTTSACLIIHVEHNPTCLLRLLPLVRLQAFEGHLNRVLKSLETEGLSMRNRPRRRDAVLARARPRRHQAEDGGGALSVARFSFEDIDRRTSIDAARVVSRLVRNVDFACRETRRLDPRRLHRDRNA